MMELIEKDVSKTVINNFNLLKDLKNTANMRKWKIRNKNSIGYV